MDPQQRQSRLTGAFLVALGAVAFSGKAVIIKLAYRYGVDAVTLLALRMLLSAPMFALLALWAAHASRPAPISNADRRALLVLGLIG